MAVPAGGDIQQVVNANPAGTTYCLAAGLYRLSERGLTYVLAVSPTATAHLAQAVPVTPAYGGHGRPPAPCYPDNLSV